jgi:hypothetical protein
MLYYDVRHTLTLDQGRRTDIIPEAVSAIAESSEAVTSPDTFDILRSFLKYASAVPAILMSKLLDLIMSGFAAEVDAAAHDIDHEDQQTCAIHKVPIEMYAFLLNWSALAAEKVTVSDEDAPAVAPSRPRRGRGGKAAQPRAAAKNRAPEWSWKGPNRARSHFDQQGFEAQDVEDLDCEWREGHIYRVRGILCASVTGYLIRRFMGLQMSHCSYIPHHGERAVHEVPAHQAGSLQSHLSRGQTSRPRTCCSNHDHAILAP